MSPNIENIRKARETIFKMVGEIEKTIIYKNKNQDFSAFFNVLNQEKLIEDLKNNFNHFLTKHNLIKTNSFNNEELNEIISLFRDLQDPRNIFLSKKTKEDLMDYSDFYIENLNMKFFDELTYLSNEAFLSIIFQKDYAQMIKQDEATLFNFNSYLYDILYENVEINKEKLLENPNFKQFVHEFLNYNLSLKNKNQCEVAQKLAMLNLHLYIEEDEDEYKFKKEYFDLKGNESFFNKDIKANVFKALYLNNGYEDSFSIDEKLKFLFFKQDCDYSNVNLTSYVQKLLKEDITRIYLNDIQDNFEKLNSQIPEFKNALLDKIIESNYTSWNTFIDFLDFLVFLNNKEQLTSKEKMKLLTEADENNFKTSLAYFLKNVIGCGMYSNQIEIDLLKKINSLFKGMEEGKLLILEPFKNAIKTNNQETIKVNLKEKIDQKLKKEQKAAKTIIKLLKN